MSKTNYSPLVVVYLVLDALKLAFPQAEIKECLQTTTDGEFYIYDHETEKRCYVHTDPDHVIHFTVKNKDEKTISFLAIDKCLLMDDDLTQRCDCAVFDEETFCLIEIKVTSSMTQRKKLRVKAKNQLKASADFFQSHMAFATKQIEAYVCLLTEVNDSQSEPDTSRTRPLNRASLVEETEEFNELGVSLFHDNRKEFT